MPKVGGYKYRNNPCGDPFEEITPPTNFGAQPTPVQAEYNAGDTIDLTVNLNANHGGYFEFRLCGQKTGLTNECFEANKLERCCLALSWIQDCAGFRPDVMSRVIPCHVPKT
jgi:hypothetical protein